MVKGRGSLSNCSINDNVIYNNGNGILLQFVTFFNIEDNLIIGNLDNGIRISTATLGDIKENYIAENGRKEEGNNGDGIESHGVVTGILIKDNIIEYNRVDGIWIDTGNHFTISGNTISHNVQSGIDIKGGSHCNILDNEICNNYWGIHFRGTSVNNKIADNRIFDNPDAGIYLLNSDVNTKSQTIFQVTEMEYF